MAPRLFAIFPALIGAVSFALIITLLVTGSSTSTSDNNNYWIFLNTSRIGRDLIHVSQANSNPSSTGNSPSAAKSPSENSFTGVLPSTLSDLGSPTLPGMSGGISGELGDIFNELLGNITAQLGHGLGDLSGELLGSLIKAIGVKDFYSLYVSKICEGNFVDPMDPNSSRHITRCSSYNNRFSGLLNITSSIPSTFSVGTTNVSVPIIASLGKSMDSVSTFASGSSKALIALLIISAVSIGMAMLGSVAVLPVGYKRMLILINTVMSLLGATVMMIFAIVTTGVVVGGTKSVDAIGNAFSLEATMGSSFLAFAWVATILALGVNLFWMAVWFVEGRRTSFKRRVRTEDQIGNYRGIMKEVMYDLKRPSAQNTASHTEEEPAEVKHQGSRKTAL